MFIGSAKSQRSGKPLGSSTMCTSSVISFSINIFATSCMASIPGLSLSGIRIIFLSFNAAYAE